MEEPTCRENSSIKRSDGASGRRLGSYALTGIAVAGLALAGLAGCARTSVEHVNVKALGLPRPQLIIVHDFGVSPSAVALDTAIGSRILEAVKGNPEADEQLKIGQAVARVVTENLVKEISKLGIPAVEAAKADPGGGAQPLHRGPVRDGRPGQPAAARGGRIRRRGERGADDGAGLRDHERRPAPRRGLLHHREELAQARLRPHGGCRRGGGGAATSVAVSAGVGLATAHSQTVEGDAKNTADEIVKVLKKFFAEQGWIAP